MTSTSALSRYQLWYGRDEPPLERQWLRAGPVTAVLEGRDLRHVRLGGLELMSRIYVAVRDPNWDTVPGEISNLRADAENDRFTVRFEVAHRQHDIDFSWRGEITGDRDGTIAYAMDGTANAAFDYKLIGICIHHPMKESAGRPYRGQTPEGSIEGALPDTVGPQFIAPDGTELPVVPAVETLAIDLSDDVSVRFAFDGDLFEMEDQRNWTDASFKTYSLPKPQGGVFHAAPGQAIRQKLTVSVMGVPAAPPAENGQPRLSLGEPVGALPRLGLGMASHGRDLSTREADLLRQLRLDHLRVDLNLGQLDWDRELARARAAAQALSCAVELALFLTNDAERQLSDLAGRLEQDPTPVARVLVFHAQEAVTAGRWVRLAREQLRAVAPNAPFAGGTNAYFCDINRFRPEIDAVDAVAYSMNPQVHAFDETSLAETLPAQAETVRSARAFCSDRPLVIGPVTLRPRFNAVATVEQPPPQPGELPWQVDPRQMSLFAAGWTVGSVKYLAESGVASVTYYETTGWRGVIETDQGSPVPQRFPSRPGMVFPVYHVFADLGEWKGGEVVACKSSAPLAVEGLAVRVGEATHLLVANLRHETQRVTIERLGAGPIAVRRLGEASAPAANADPQRFRAAADRAEVTDDELVLTLAPFEVVRLDAPRRA